MNNTIDTELDNILFVMADTSRQYEKSQVRKRMEGEMRQHRKAKRMCSALISGYPCPYCARDKEGRHWEKGFPDTQYMRETILRAGNVKYWKHVSNRRVRQAKEVSMRGSGYKKQFDLWWTVW